MLKQALAAMSQRLEAVRAPARPAGAHPVGVCTLALPGGPAELWYPAQPGAQEAAQIYAQAFRGRAARDAPPAAGRWPLFVASHGQRGGRFDLSWLGEGLAADGALVLAPDHAGSTAQDYDPDRAVRLWLRAHALSASLDALLTHPRWGASIDPQRVFAAGHSAGGSTVLLLLGARIAPQLFAHRFPQVGAADAATAAVDPRFAGALALAPGTGVVFDAVGLQAARRPVLIVSGTADWHTPDALCAAHYHRHLPDSQWERVQGGGHYVFKPLCIPYGLARAPTLCADGPCVRRAAVHRRILALTHSRLLAQRLST